MATQTIIIESNRQIAYKSQLDSLRSNTVSGTGDQQLQEFSNNKWRTTLQFGQKVSVGDQISLEAAMINSRGGGDSVMEFTGKTGASAGTGNDIDDSRANISFGFYVNNRYQFNFVHPKSTFLVKRDIYAMNYGGPVFDGEGRGSINPINPSDVDEFQSWVSSFPYKSIEGFSRNEAIPRVFTVIPPTTTPGGGQNYPTFMKPNVDFYNPTSDRFYIGNEFFTGPYYNYLLPNNQTNNLWDFYKEDVVVEVPKGFSTPGAIGERLTAQLHQRDGDAAKWVVKTIQPSVFRIGETSGKITQTIMPGVSDKTYQAFKTSTGQCLYARGNYGLTDFRGWNSAFLGEKTSAGDPTDMPAGTNYQRNQGNYQFWSQTTCANPFRFKATCQWLSLQRQPFTTNVFNPLNIEDYSIYTGDQQRLQITPVSGGGPFQIGDYGSSGVCILDVMPTERGTYIYGTGAVPPTYNTGHVQYKDPNAGLWKQTYGDAVTCNILLTDNNLDIIEKTFELAKRIDTSVTSNDVKNQSFMDANSIEMTLGRIDDEATLSVANRMIYLPAPFIFNTMGAGGSSFHYIAPAGANPPTPPAEPAQGYSYTLDIKTTDHTNFNAAAVVVPRIIGGDNQTKTNMNTKCFVYKQYSWTVDDAMNNVLKDSKGIRMATNLFPDNILSNFQTALPSGDINVLKSYYKRIGDKNKGLGLGMIPVFLKPTVAVGDKAKLLNIPFLANIISVTSNNTFPNPAPGEYWGLSPTMTQNGLGKLITTQKTSVDAPYPQYNDLLPPTQVQDYMPYLYVGASDSLINFDDTYSRFTISQLHTAVKSGNGVFQNVDLEPNNSPEDDNLTAYEQEAALCTIGVDGLPVNYTSQLAAPINQSIISAQSGVSILGLDAYINIGKSADASPLVPLSVLNISSYENTLFDKMGFSLEQILPLYGRVQNEFNRGNANRYLGFEDVDLYNKSLNMVKPFTTNAYISASIVVSLAQGIASTPSNPAQGIVYNTGAVPMANLGGLIARQARTNADSDLLIASGMPQKLDYPYLVVYTDIVRNSLYIGGPDGQQKLSAIAYITRNYAEGDFFYSFATSWSYTVDQDYIITDITTDIRLPDGSPAPIDNNSSVIYKIQQVKSMPAPPPLTPQQLKEEKKIS